MTAVVESYQSDRRLLWGLCYRMTGSSADADDLVQETFVRALERPPERKDLPMRPWLVRVAMNLSRDHLRRRQRTAYVGEWLPTPVPTDDLASPASHEPIAPGDESPAARYEMLESVSFAFLLALEALTPAQRAVLLLRDVFDYSTAEVAGALDMSDESARVTLFRARAKMKEYDRNRAPLSPARNEATRQALDQFLALLAARDVSGMEQLLAETVVSVSDGGGEVAAALNVIEGRDRVVRLIFGLNDKMGPTHVSFRILNGLPTAIVETGDSRTGHASRFTLHLEVNDAGLITRLNTVVAPAKLIGLPLAG